MEKARYFQNSQLREGQGCGHGKPRQVERLRKKGRCLLLFEQRALVFVSPGLCELWSWPCLLGRFHTYLVNCDRQLENHCPRQLNGPQAFLQQTDIWIPVPQRAGCVTVGQSLRSQLLCLHLQTRIRIGFTLRVGEV